MPNGVPPTAEGSIVVLTASVVIDAPIERVWSVLLDFKGYDEWNAFVRKQTVFDPKTSVPYPPEQKLEPGMHIKMEVHIPPTLGKPGLFGKQGTTVQVTTVDNEHYRAAWVSAPLLPKSLLFAERWQMLTDLGNGKTRYENIETINGILAYLVKFFVGKNLQLAVDAMAQGLKTRSEESR